MTKVNIPLCSVVIPSYGQVGVALTDECLRSAKEANTGLAIQYIVVDDGSGDAVAWELAEVCNAHDAQLVVLKENGGFAKACNAGLRASNGMVTILLNNDVIMDHCPALQILCDTVLQTNAAVAGTRLLYPDRTIQHAGVMFVPAQNESIPGYWDHFLRGQPETHYAALTMRPSLVTGACFAIHRNAIGAFGLLDERYGMAAEDIDYCMEAISMGWSAMYNGYAWAIHHEGKTRGRTPEEKERLAPDAWQKEKLGLVRFFRKWITVDWSVFMER